MKHKPAQKYSNNLYDNIVTFVLKEFHKTLKALLKLRTLSIMPEQQFLITPIVGHNIVSMRWVESKG